MSKIKQVIAKILAPVGPFLSRVAFALGRILAQTYYRLRLDRLTTRFLATQMGKILPPDGPRRWIFIAN